MNKYLKAIALLIAINQVACGNSKKERGERMPKPTTYETSMLTPNQPEDREIRPFRELHDFAVNKITCQIDLSSEYQAKVDPIQGSKELSYRILINLDYNGRMRMYFTGTRCDTVIAGEVLCAPYSKLAVGYWAQDRNGMRLMRTQDLKLGTLSLVGSKDSPSLVLQVDSLDLRTIGIPDQVDVFATECGPTSEFSNIK